MATTTYGSPYVSGTDLVANWPAASLTVAQSIDSAGYYIGRGNNTQTGSYTTVLTDAGKVITMSNASANTVTIPANASVAYVVGTRINILNLGAGACTPTAGAGVTIAGTISALATNGSASLVKTATNTWSYIAGGGGGKILQVVSTTYSTSTNNATSTYADTGLTLAITPAFASSKVLVIISQNLLANRLDSSTTAYAGCRIVRTSTTVLTNDYAMLIRAAVNGQTNLDASASISLTFLDSPNTTSATTYKTQFNIAAGATATAQVGGSTSVITLMEVGA